MRKLAPLPETILSRHREMYAAKTASGLCGVCKTWKAASSTAKEYLSAICDFNQWEKGRLLVGEAAELAGLVKQVDGIVGVGKVSKEIKSINGKLQEVFDYASFAKQVACGGIEWGGGALMLEITKRVRYCPYCNAETVFGIQVKKDGKPRVLKSAFDHFFPRKRYPFLGVAPYNLIPACSRCNTNLKRDKWKHLVDMPHPYLNPDVHSTMRFVPVLNPGANCSRPTTDIIQRLLVIPRTCGNRQQTCNYQDIFRTEDVYTALFRQEAADVIWKAVSMTSSYGDVIAEFVAHTGLCRQDFERLVWGAPLTDKDINRNRLAKLTIDLEEEFARPRGLDLFRSLSSFSQCHLRCSRKGGA